MLAAYIIRRTEPNNEKGKRGMAGKITKLSRAKGAWGYAIDFAIITTPQIVPLIFLDYAKTTSWQLGLYGFIVLVTALVLFNRDTGHMEALTERDKEIYEKENAIRVLKQQIDAKSNEIEAQKKSNEALNKKSDQELMVSACIANIIEQKNSRFRENLTKFIARDKQEIINAGEVFCQITRPLDQITEIINQLRAFFYQACKEEAIVIIFRPDTDRYNQLIASPNKDHVTPEIGILPLNKGVVGAAHHSTDLVLVEDIALDIKSRNPTYIVGHDTPDRAKRGSIFAKRIPVPQSENREDWLILSVYVDRPGYFLHDNKRNLEKRILDPFINRIAIELKLLKMTDLCGI